MEADRGADDHDGAAAATSSGVVSPANWATLKPHQPAHSNPRTKRHDMQWVPGFSDRTALRNRIDPAKKFGAAGPAAVSRLAQLSAAREEEETCRLLDWITARLRLFQAPTRV